MALATYFDKAALSAQSLLANFNVNAFRRTLEDQLIEVHLGDKALGAEDSQTVELLTDLLSRLYPRLQFSAGGAAALIVPQLTSKARAINSQISIEESSAATLSIAVGHAKGGRGSQVLHVGSDSWICRVSRERLPPSGTSENPFGAGMAACLGAAWAFQETFARQLPQTNREPGSLCMSLLDLSSGPAALNREWQPVDIGLSYLVGVGAIGSAAAWALSRCAGIRGTISLIDHEIFEESNLQRYVATIESDIGVPKVALAERQLANAGKLQVLAHHRRWESFAAQGHGPLERVLLALDSAEARIRVQASLPRWIGNAWTQPENIGVSRHASFLDGPCVACFYMSAGPRKNLDQLIAAAIGFTSEEELREVRALLHTGRPVGRQFLDRMCTKLGVPLDLVEGFHAEPLSAFYARGVCGGLLIPFVLNGNAEQAQVPMAFQSAAAGLLLAAELVGDAGGFRPSLPARSELNLLRGIQSLASHPHSPAAKHASGRCICQDGVFRSAYERRWNSNRLTRNTGDVSLAHDEFSAISENP